MSWTQGIHVREDMTEAMIDLLESGYAKATGETAKVEYITWHEIDGSDAVAHFDSQRGFKIGKAP